MRKISNNPLQRMQKTYPYVQFDNVFSEEEIEKITKEFSVYGADSAKVDDNNLDESIRRSNIKFHNYNNENAWIFQRFNGVIERINEDFYNFDLNGYSYFQYGEYNSSNLGKYDFHMDTFMGDSTPTDQFETRKLSVVFLLNQPNVDFKGGDFQICLGLQETPVNVAMKKGRMIAFPSFLIHKVTEVTEGIRKSIAIWVTGPKFK